MRVLQTLIAFSGNAPPQLAVTRELLARGHEVRVLAHSAARERIERTGAEFVAFKRTAPEIDWSRREGDTLRDWDAHGKLHAGVRLLRNGMFGLVVNTARDCTEQLSRWPADLVLYDWMLAGAAVSAHAGGVPAVALVHCPYPLPSDAAPPLFSGLGPGHGRLGALRDRTLRLGSARILKRGLPFLNKARAEHGLPPLDDWNRQLLDGDAIYVLTAPQLDFASNGALPANVEYVGPAFEPFEQDWSSPWPQSNNDPLIVISFSTSFMNQSALAQRVLDAAGGLPVRALLTAGPALDTGPLRVPSNARVVEFVAHRSVFPRASLVICHAGWQTINAALADGVPLLCIPDGRDQPDNALRVALIGAGIRTGKGSSVAKLRAKISQALADPELKHGAQRAAVALASSDGAARVAENLQRIVERRQEHAEQTTTGRVGAAADDAGSAEHHGDHA